MNLLELKNYITKDLSALGIDKKIKIFTPGDLGNISRFQIYMRLLEFCKGKKYLLFFSLIIRFLYVRKGFKLGFSIPIGVFGPGLAIVHKGTIIISGEAVIGSNCRIHAQTNIGKNPSKNGAPIIGDNVYIGPGAKLFGNIVIASNSKIGANAVVNKSFLDEGSVILGVPARKYE